MRISWIFSILAILILGLGLTMLFQPQINTLGWIFYLSEGVLALCLVLLIIFYGIVIKPINSVAFGMELLRAQDFSSRLAHVKQVEADRIIEIFNRMMEQLKNERLRLRERNHFLDLLVNVSPMGIVIFDMDHHITALNRAACTMLEIENEESVAGLTLEQIDSPLAKAIRAIPQSQSDTVRLSDAMIYRCSRLAFQDQGFPHPFLLIESLTDEVINAEKKAYEKVIRMIAHEVNNSMAGVNSTLDTVGAMLEDTGDNDTAEVLHACQDRCLSMSRFITSFADVVKIPEAKPVRTDLNQRLEVCSDFIERMCEAGGVKVHWHLDAEQAEVMLDPILFEQVLVNIVKNSIESIGDKGGDIDITTSTPPLKLVITDNGSGISAEAESKLFSPFYSSKPNGQGLGLIFISDVLTKHGCRFSLRTDHDGLTRFTIMFKPAKPND